MSNGARARPPISHPPSLTHSLSFSYADNKEGREGCAGYICNREERGTSYHAIVASQLASHSLLFV